MVPPGSLQMANPPPLLPCATAPNVMQILVRTMTGKTIAVRLTLDSTTDELKQAIKDKEGALSKAGCLFHAVASPRACWGFD